MTVSISAILPEASEAFTILINIELNVLGYAAKAFEKALGRADIETIVAGAERYRDDPNREQRFTKNPATWLNADAWENEPEPARKGLTKRDEALRRAAENAIKLRELENQRGNSGKD